MGTHNTGIEWTWHEGFRGETWNPLVAIDKETDERGWFCTHVSEGCRNCYAETLNVEQRWNLGTGHEYKHQNLSKIRWDLRNLDQPLRWEKPRAVFVNSMTDLFHEDLPGELIDKIFAVMAAAPEHRFMVLTKRPGLMRDYMHPQYSRDFTSVAPLSTPERIFAEGDFFEKGHDQSVSHEWPPPNVWLGTSTENQPAANERIPYLLDTPASVRFVSAEPLLDLVDFSRIEAEDNYAGGKHVFNALSERKDDGRYFTRTDEVRALDWVIVGGESGSNARPMHPDWARSIKNECQSEGVPFFMKQGSENGAFWDDHKDFDSFPSELQVRQIATAEFSETYAR